MWNAKVKSIFLLITSLFVASCELVERPTIAIAGFELQAAPEDSEILSLVLTLTRANGDKQTKDLDPNSRYVELELEQGKYVIELSAITSTGEFIGKDEIVLTGGEIKQVDLDLSFIESPLIRIDISPASSNIAAGTNRQFKAEGTYENKRKEDITNSVSWSTSDSAKASIDEGGLVNAFKTGSVTIAASLKGVRTTAKLEVSSAVLESIAVTPEDVTVTKGETQQFTATGTYSDNSTQDITSSVDWSSSDTDIATISSEGVANSIAAGTVTITAKSGNLTDTASVTVKVLQFDTGQHFVMAIKAEGSLWAWGRNQSGQLGDGTTSLRKNPKQIGTDTDWHRIVAAKLHTLAIKNDGTLWAWGFNSNGQLGDGTTYSKHIPTQVGSATNWSAIAGGPGHTLALKSDGTLWAWGYNVYGQLGDGTTQQKTALTQEVTGATNWSTIAATSNSSGFTLALKSSGTPTVTPTATPTATPAPAPAATSTSTPTSTATPTPTRSDHQSGPSLVRACRAS